MADESVLFHEIVSNRKRKKPRKAEVKRIKLNVDDGHSMDILSEHFSRDEVSGNIICSVEDCNSSVARWQLYFFKRHFETKHPTLLRELFPDAYDHDTQCQIAMCELDYNATELVTINGFPFSILNASAIKGFLKKQVNDLNKMDTKSLGVSFHSK